MVLALDPSATAQDKLSGVVNDVRKTVNSHLAGTGLHGELSGVPVMQHEIRDAIQRDRLIYNSLGFLAGCLIAVLFFRRISFMIIAAAPPLSAILLALGALGWLDFRLNLFLNVMTPLIMVISFSDSMQLTFAARDRLLAGEDKFTAFRNALLIVGPACVLTHATAGISFIALQFSQSDLIRTFGQAGLIAVAVALVAVLIGVPLLGVLLVHNEAGFVARVKGMDKALDVLRRLCGWIAVQMVARPGLYSLIGLIVVIVLSAGYAQLEPRYRLADQVPDREQAVKASQRLDVKLTGANPFDVLIEFPKGKSLYAPETLAVIAEVHKLLEEQPGVGNVWSLETLRRWLAEKMNKSDVDTLKQYVDLLPPYLTRRFISAEQNAVIVSGRVPDKDASKLLPIVDSLDKKLNTVREKNPGYTDCDYRTGGDFRAQQRVDDQQAEPRPDDRDRLCRGIYRHRLPLAPRHADQRLAGSLSHRACRLRVVGIWPGTAICQRYRADGLVRAGLERHHPFSQPAADRGYRTRSRGRRRARHHIGRPAVDPDLGGARLRPGDDGALQPAVAAPVRLVERLCHDRGVDRRFVHVTADCHVPEQHRAADVVALAGALAGRMSSQKTMGRA